MRTTPAGGWVCFHCSDVFTDVAAAQEHFGIDSEWQPGCVDPLTKDEQEGRKYMVDMTLELDGERDECYRLREENEQLGHTVQAHTAALRSRFGVDTVYDAFNKFDSMEGRVIAAEAMMRWIRNTHPSIAQSAQDYVCRPKDEDESDIPF